MASPPLRRLDTPINGVDDSGGPLPPASLFLVIASSSSLAMVSLICVIASSSSPAMAPLTRHPSSSAPRLSAGGNGGSGGGAVELPNPLGRRWKMYSRVVYMLSDIGDHINPVGWLEWNATVGVDSLYYGEYMNHGPGAAVEKRVTWPGYTVITMPEEASGANVDLS